MDMKVIGFSIPQHFKAPPYIEAKRIISYFLLFAPLDLMSCYYWLIQNYDFPSAIGRLFAFTIFTIHLIIRMRVVPEKAESCDRRLRHCLVP